MLSIEDNYDDILGKAQRGLGMADSELAEKADVSIEALKRVRDGEFEESTVRKLAPVLNLNADALVISGQKAWRPEPISLEGLATFTTPFEDILVNAYIVWDPSTKDAALFDSGADGTEMLEFLDEHGLNARSILLTHTHGDHILDLDRLRERTGATAYVSSKEAIGGAECFEEGKTFNVGGLKIGTRLTSGHSPGGITYVIDGLARPVAIVGDSLFAGSMGGPKISYEDALRNNREKVLTLPDDTVLCPGHGPLTTVAEEKAHNPFFA